MYLNPLTSETAVWLIWPSGHVPNQLIEMSKGPGTEHRRGTGLSIHPAQTMVPQVTKDQCNGDLPKAAVA